MARRLRHWLIGLGCCAVGLLVLALRFPIFMRFPDLVVRHESAAALSEWIDYITYLHIHLGALVWNPETGLKEFGPTIAKEKEASKPDLLKIGKLEWHRGNFAEAVRQIEAHHTAGGESESSLFWLAMSYLRLGEARNCLAQHESAHQHEGAEHQGMCTLPLTSYHSEPSYSRQAARQFERLLDEYDSESRLYQWLLNFSLMTVGDFPAAVPEAYRVAPAFFDQFYGGGKKEAEARYANLRFVDQAQELGVDTFDAGKGVAVEDFDRDGYLDIITGGIFDPMRFYHNDEGRGFLDRSLASGLSQFQGTHIMTAADYDNDGWMDLFASRPMGSEKGDYVLLRNEGDATFRDVTVEMGLLPAMEERELYTLTWASAWGDMDNDGDVDLFISNWGFYTAVGADERLNPLSGNRSAQLLRNDGDRFVDVTKESGVAKIIWGRSLYGAAFGDYNGDGHLDLAFTPQWIPGLVLAKNLGGGRFEATDLIDSRSWGFMTAFVDVNHDGRLDLYVGSTGPAPGITKQAVYRENQEDYGTRSAIWLQKPDGSFASHEDFFPGEMPLATMGTNFGDLNNDGAYDFYFGTGSPEGWMIFPNLMFVGVRDGSSVTGRTENISMLNDFGTVQKGHGIVFFDFDEDGDQDVYSSLGGLWPGDRWPNQMFVNHSDRLGTWTKIRLRGRKNNYYGLGARIRVTVANEQGETWTHHYYMDNGTGFGSTPYLAHLGLGDAVAIKRVEVTWPGEATPQVYDVELEATNLLDENGSAQVLRVGSNGHASAAFDGTSDPPGGLLVAKEVEG